MAESQFPILLPQDTWYKSSNDRSTITQINILDAADDSVSTNYDEMWNADVDDVGCITCYVTDGVLTIAGSGQGVRLSADAKNTFRNFSNVVSITGANNLVTSDVTSMQSMFYNCSKLTTVDVSNWDTSNVQTMHTMFYKCYELETLDVSQWDTSNVTDMTAMFNMHISGGTNTKLTRLDVSDWNTSKVTSLFYTFNNCTGLSELDVSNWDTSSVTDMRYTFCLCSSLTNLDVSGWNTSNVTDMTSMFWHATSLTTIDVSNWDVSKVTSFGSMFAGNNNAGDMLIVPIGIENWNTVSATHMNSMFYGCSQIQSLDLGGWNVSNVTNMSHMFTDCFSLASINFAGWNTSACETMDGIFNDCMSLVIIDVSDFDTSSNKAFSQMFEGCEKLKSIIGLEKFNTSSGVTFTEMFSNCYELVALDLSSFDTTHATDGAYVYNNVEYNAMSAMFANMHSLKEITLGENFRFDGDGTISTPAVLPVPNSEYISGADGNWYDLDWNAYATTAIPTGVAATYYASIDVANELCPEYLIRHMTLTKLANKVRALTKTTGKMAIEEMISALKGLITYSVTNNLTNCTNSNSATTVDDGSSYEAAIMADDGYMLGDSIIPAKAVLLPGYKYSKSGKKFNANTANSCLIVPIKDEQISNGRLTIELTGMTRDNGSLMYGATNETFYAYDASLSTQTTGMFTLTPMPDNSATTTTKIVFIVITNETEYTSINNCDFVLIHLTYTDGTGASVSVAGEQIDVEVVAAPTDVNTTATHGGVTTYGSIDVTMGGAPVAVDLNTINIASVTGDIVITATAVEEIA